MKRILMLIACLLLALPVMALAEEADGPVLLTTPDGLTLAWTADAPEGGQDSDAALLVQHYCTAGQYESAFALNEKLAALGSADAMYRLGCHFLNGLGTPQDESAALAWFTAARDAGCDRAARALILAQLNGWGMPQDTLGAAAALTEAGFSADLALLYLHGAYDIPAHEATAMHWFDLSCGQLAQTDPDLYQQRLAAFLATSPAALTDRLPVQHEDWADPAAQARIALGLGSFWREGRGGVTDPQSAATWYAHAAFLGVDPEATLAHEALAEMHLSGEMGAVNVGEAIRHLLACTLNPGHGAYRTGMLYWDGLVAADGTVLLAQDRATALTYLTQAADAGSNAACHLLGEAYRTGESVPASAHTAAHYYALGLRDTDSVSCYDPLLAMYQQGLLYDRAIMDEIYAGLRSWQGADHQLPILLAEHWLNGLTAADGAVLVQQDRKAACELMEFYHDHHSSRHEAPEVYFLNWLGWFYSGNAPEAVERDYPKALQFYIESARQGNGYAMTMAGVFYQNGRGVSVDHMAARAWYEQAIAAGNTSAQGYLDALNADYPDYPTDLALTLTTADGLTLAHTVNPDGHAAPTNRAALTDAELMLAGWCHEGQWSAAMDMERQLADMGDIAAMCRLGRHYASGQSAVFDDAQAIDWLRRAADAGHDGAVYTLALMYLNGWGVAQDAPRALGMIESLGGDAPLDPTLHYLLATLLRDGHATLAPNVEKAQQHLAAALAALPQEEAAAMQAAWDASTGPDARLLTRPQPITEGWLEPDYTFCLVLGQFWQEGRGGTVSHAEAARWYEQALPVLRDPAPAKRALALILRDGLAGYHDAQRAIVLLCQIGAYEEVAAMFDTGVTGADGQVCLAPNAIIAQAFRAWLAGDMTSAARLGDLFRDGSIVDASPDLAAAFYLGDPQNPYCASQLTALAEAGLVTDEALLQRIAALPPALPEQLDLPPDGEPLP